MVRWNNPSWDVDDGIRNETKRSKTTYHTTSVSLQPPKKKSKKRSRSSAIPEAALDQDRIDEITITFQHALKKQESKFTYTSKVFRKYMIDVADRMMP